MNKEDRLYKLFQGPDTAVWAHDEIVNQDKRIAELEKGYEELRIAALHAVCKIGGGQAKADLRDAYDKATEYLKALKEQE